MMDTVDNNSTGSKEPTTSAKPMKTAAGIAYTYLCNAFKNAQDDPCIDYRLTGRIAAGIARQIEDGAVHTASTLNGAAGIVVQYSGSTDLRAPQMWQTVASSRPRLARIASGGGALTQQSATHRRASSPEKNFERALKPLLLEE